MKNKFMIIQVLILLLLISIYLYGKMSLFEAIIAGFIVTLMCTLGTILERK